MSEAGPPVHRVELTPRARRQLDALRGEVFQRLSEAILALAEQPRPHGAIKLKGPIYRLRVGTWRIIYAVFDREQVVIVGKVARRSEDTYDELGRLF